jgi:hypothetical protein
MPGMKMMTTYGYGIFIHIEFLVCSRGGIFIQISNLIYDVKKQHKYIHPCLNPNSVMQNEQEFALSLPQRRIFIYIEFLICSRGKNHSSIMRAWKKKMQKV